MVPRRSASCDLRRLSSACAFVAVASVLANIVVRTPASSRGATARSTRSYIWRHSGGLDKALPPARVGNIDRPRRLPEVLRWAHFAAEDLAGRALGQVGLDPDVA